jgi:hypothetical protein
MYKAMHTSMRWGSLPRFMNTLSARPIGDPPCILGNLLRLENTFRHLQVAIHVEVLCSWVLLGFQNILRLRPLGGPPSGENPLIKETPLFQEVPALVGETSSRTPSS